jgi:hypothetical protein
LEFYNKLSPILYPLARRTTPLSLSQAQAPSPSSKQSPQAFAPSQTLYLKAPAPESMEHADLPALEPVSLLSQQYPNPAPPSRTVELVPRLSQQYPNPAPPSNSQHSIPGFTHHQAATSSHAPSFTSSYAPSFSQTPPDSRPQCEYGAKCYRRNSSHLAAFRHVTVARAAVSATDTPRALSMTVSSHPVLHIAKTASVPASTAIAATSAAAALWADLDDDVLDAFYPPTSASATSVTHPVNPSIISSQATSQSSEPEVFPSSPPALASSQSESSSVTEKLCVICIDNEATLLMLPCSHLILW